MLCDCWSLGCILFILCVGEAPFKLGGASEADRRKVTKGDFKFGPAWNRLPGAKNVVEHLLKVNFSTL